MVSSTDEQKVKHAVIKANDQRSESLNQNYDHKGRFVQNYIKRGPSPQQNKLHQIHGTQAGKTRQKSSNWLHIGNRLLGFTHLKKVGDVNLTILNGVKKTCSLG